MIQGTRITLRPLTPADASDEYLSWLNDPEVNRYSRRRGTTETMDGLRSWLEHETPNRFGIFIPRHIGGISLSADSELNIMIGARDVWGQGYATEAITLLADHAHRSGFERVWAESPNPAFNATMRKLGWTLEGTKPSPLGELMCWANELSAGEHRQSPRRDGSPMRP